MGTWECWYMVFDPCWLLLKLFLIKTKETFKNIGVQSDIYSNTFNAFLASLQIHYTAVLTPMLSN